MAETPLALVGDLGDWLGEPIPEGADEARAELCLRMASALVREASGRSWIDESGGLVNPLPDAVYMTALACAGRGYTNPDGWEEEALDDWRGRRRLAEVGLYLTESERDLLSKYRGSRFGGVGRISTTRGDIGAPDDQRWIVNGPDPLNPWDEGWI